MNVPRIVIHMEGGVIHAVYSEIPVRVMFADEDIEGKEDEAVVGPFADRQLLYFREEEASTSADMVEAYFACVIDPEENA